MRNLIKQILREEVQILPNVRRRLRLGNIGNDMKKNALSHYEKGKSPNIIINQAARFTAADIVPWHDEQGADYDDDTHEGWINSVKDFLIKKYGELALQLAPALDRFGKYNKELQLLTVEFVNRGVSVDDPDSLIELINAELAKRGLSE